MADRNKSAESERNGRSPQEQVRALYDEAESQTAKALEELVSKPSFGLLMARSAENVAALTRIGSDVADLMLRNLRLAGRADITRLARQLHRTEDKLEQVLQEVEGLRDELRRRDEASGNGRDPGKRSGKPTGSRKATETEP